MHTILAALENPFLTWHLIGNHEGWSLPKQLGITMV